MRRVAVTPHSATSVALLRVLVGADVEFVPQQEDVATTLRTHDGVLLIADEALHALRTPPAPFNTDLGERWRALTGLPMVFAVWAVRRDAASANPELVARLARVIHDAPEAHAADPESVVRAATERFPFPADFIRRYFTRLSYGFGPQERAGLTRFLNLAHAANELAAVPTLAA